MEYAKYDSLHTAGNNVVTPDYTEYDMDSLLLSREIHAYWKMGFSLDKKKDGKKLIEDILKESKSYPRFNSGGKFGFININDSYSFDDINKIIDISDILKYKFNETKREDIITSAKMYYRYDYGHKKYTMFLEKNIGDYIPEYVSTGYSYYHIDQIDGHKDINLDYHTDRHTVELFMEHTLLNNCNTHNIVEMTLPLSYMDLTVSDIIYFPLINNEKIFDIDYSVVSYKNSQPIYPLWLILETNISTDSVKIKAYQLHYLKEGGNHGFSFPERFFGTDIYTGEDIIVNPPLVGNVKQFHSTYTFTTGEPIPNWNYNPEATEDNGIEIPYFDFNADTYIGDTEDASDYEALIWALVEGDSSMDHFTDFQMEILKYNADGSLNTNIDNVQTIYELWDVIAYNE